MVRPPVGTYIASLNVPPDGALATAMTGQALPPGRTEVEMHGWPASSPHRRSSGTNGSGCCAEVRHDHGAVGSAPPLAAEPAGSAAVADRCAPAQPAVGLPAHPDGVTG